LLYQWIDIPILNDQFIASDLFIVNINHARLHVDVVQGVEVCPRLSIVVPVGSPSLSFDYVGK